MSSLPNLALPNWPSRRATTHRDLTTLDDACCSVSAEVMVKNSKNRVAKGTVIKAHTTLVDYDILYPNGDVQESAPVHLLRDARVSAL